jgi:hypothetical protein
MKSHPDDELVNRLISGLARDTGFARERLRNALTWQSDTEYHPSPQPPPERENPGRPIKEVGWWPLW